ncbi:MAG TPA: hypothetical protein VGB89_14485 [Bacteroidota bacterium]|jgi:uncharacterized protein YhhL (DUF1145 family)
MIKEKNHLLAAAFWLLVILSFVLPRFIKNSEGGFAAASSAVLIFLLLLVLASVVALFLFISTYQKRGSLSTASRLSGFLPLPLVVLGLIMLVSFLRY